MFIIKRITVFLSVEEHVSYIILTQIKPQNIELFLSNPDVLCSRWRGGKILVVQRWHIGGNERVKIHEYLFISIFAFLGRNNIDTF